MVVHLHTVCYNEIDLIPVAIKYWKLCCDHVFVYVMESTDDGSLEELCKYQDFITVFKIKDNNEINDGIIIYIKNNCWKASRGKADFVIVTDFDEFIYSNYWKSELEYMKNNGMTIVAPRVYHLVSENEVLSKYNNEKLLHKYVKYGTPDDLFGKHCIFNPNEIEEINYLPGAHRCYPKGNVKYYDGTKIFLLHAKYLGRQWFLDRMNRSGKRLSELNRKQKWGLEYLYSEEEKNKLFDDKLNNKVNIIFEMI